jgi:hypothetical protein
MIVDKSLSTYFGKESYLLPETAIVRDYIHYLIDSNYKDKNLIISETLVFGLGCGLALNFRKSNSEKFYISTVNEILMKDFITNMNIKGWYKTEPNPSDFITHICRILDKNQPVVTYLEKCENGCLFRKVPIAITGYSSTSKAFTYFDYCAGKTIELEVSEFLKASNFKDVGAVPSNFWFEIVMPEQFFPYKKSIVWALAKNIQSLLYPANKQQGLLSIKSLLQYIQEISEKEDVVSTSNNVNCIQKGLKNAERNSVANLELFIDFLTIANEIIEIEQFDKVITLFESCENAWNNFYTSLNEVVTAKFSNKSSIKILHLGDHVFETYNLALNELSKSLTKVKFVETLS